MKQHNPLIACLMGLKKEMVIRVYKFYLESNSLIEIKEILLVGIWSKQKLFQRGWITPFLINSKTSQILSPLIWARIFVHLCFVFYAYISSTIYYWSPWIPKEELYKYEPWSGKPIQRPCVPLADVLKKEFFWLTYYVKPGNSWVASGSQLEKKEHVEGYQFV